MRYVYLLIGSIAFAIGTIAIWIPGIPTTGFYVLAAFCWTRSSKRLYNWLIANKYYKEYVEKGVYKRQLSQKKRIMIYLFSAAFMAIPFFTVPGVWLKYILVGCSLSQIISMEGFYRGWFMNTWFRKMPEMPAYLQDEEDKRRIAEAKKQQI